MIQKLLSAGLMLLALSTTQAQTDGTLDTSFGSNGIVTTNIGIKDFNVLAQAIQPDGKRVLVGESVDLEQKAAFVTRLNQDGSLDTSFGIDGKRVFDFATLAKVVIQPDGKIIAAGSKIIRLNADSSIDASFGTNGSIAMVKFRKTSRHFDATRCKISSTLFDYNRF